MRPGTQYMKVGGAIAAAGTALSFITFAGGYVGAPAGVVGIGLLLLIVGFFQRVIHVVAGPKALNAVARDIATCRNLLPVNQQSEIANRIRRVREKLPLLGELDDNSDVDTKIEIGLTELLKFAEMHKEKAANNIDFYANSITAAWLEAHLAKFQNRYTEGDFQKVDAEINNFIRALS